jgi:MFS transporter, ACS family, tartrate transporter
MVLPWLVTATGCVVLIVAQNEIIVLMALTLVIVAQMAALSPFYTMSSSFLSGPAAAGSIALVNVFGTGLGGFLGPTVVGKLKEQTGDYSAGMAAMAAALVVAAAIVLVLGRPMVARPFMVKPTI